MTVAWMIVAGGIGSVLRWAIEEVVERRRLAYRPYATMAVNAIGCLIAAAVSNAASLTSAAHATIYLTGFCGGFTTFSSALAIPTIKWTDGNRVSSSVILVGTPLACVAFFAIGLAL